MTETAKQTATAKFEQTSEAMPRLTTAGRLATAEQLTGEIPAPGVESAAESGKAGVRSIRVQKLDQRTVWRVIELLKSL